MARRLRTRTVSAACALLALCLIVVDSRGGIGGAVRGWAGAATGPVERAVAAVMQPLTRLGAGNSAALATLRAENQALRDELGSAARAQVSAESLRELSALAPAAGFTRIPTHVVALSGPADLVRSASIAAGSRAGVAPGQVVICRVGALGVVDTVSPTTATVRLLSDRASSVLVRVVASKELGFLAGAGRESAGRLVPLDQLAELRSGQLLVTAGAGDASPFPAGLPVGRIDVVSGSAADLSRAAAVRFAADESTLDEVMVLAPEAAR